jgi:FkbM family methyltransferase
MFEIEPKKIFLIKKSIQLNSFESHVYFIKKAVSDLKSKSTIYFSKNTSSQLSQSMNIRRNKPDIFRGETVNLNEYPFPSSLSIFILRVDVQGHELHVFRSAEKLFHEHRVHHVIFEYTPWGTPTPVQKEIFDYMKTILGAKKFYALHPKQPIIYGPLNDVDMNEFYSQHNKEHLQRDVYALFKDEETPITSNAYSFQTSF